MGKKEIIQEVSDLWNQGLRSFNQLVKRLEKENTLSEKEYQEIEFAWRCLEQVQPAGQQEEEFQQDQRGFQKHINRANLLEYWQEDINQLKWEYQDDWREINVKLTEGIAVITINRPHKRNAFTPITVKEMCDVFRMLSDNTSIGVILLRGEGTEAFCSGGDQSVRGGAGYKHEDGSEVLNVLELQRIIRACPKPVIAMVAGYCVGGGHVLHMVCDLTIAAENAIFAQTGPKVGSFDGGFGSSYMANLIGQKRAREIWFLCLQYSAQEAYEMGLINIVCSLEEWEQVSYAWALQILSLSPTAIRCLKSALNADTDGILGLQQLAGDATYLFYQTQEGQEGKNAFLNKRSPRFRKYLK